MTGDRIDETILQPAAAEAVDRRGRRLVLILGVLTVLLIGAGLTVFLIDRSQRIDDITALAQQVTELGGTPVVQAPGLPGPEGRPGRDGRDGADGTDGVTPACVSEPAQCRGANGDAGASGADGVDGQPGKDGADGKDGRDGIDGISGQPPASWTWTDAAGREQTCTRNPDSPDTAPTYSCTAPSTGPPGTTTSNPPLLRIGG